MLKSPFARSLLIGLSVIVAVVIYAYGFQVTKVDLAQTQKPERIVQLARILRAIAQPDIIEYEQVEQTVRAPVQIPCAGDPPPFTPDTSKPYITLTPACAEEGAAVIVEGFNFDDSTEGPLFFIPPSEVHLQLATVQTDSDGHFSHTVKLPKRAEPQTQYIEATLRANVGAPRFTQGARDTWDKIIETVFLALLATTLGIAVSIPVSFLAAQNLMRPITSPLAPLSLTLLAFPFGLVVGALFMQTLGNYGLQIGANSVVGLVILIVGIAGSVFALRWALPQEETVAPSAALRTARGFALFGVAAVFGLELGVLAALGQTVGNALTPLLGSFSFIGFFIFSISNALSLLLSTIGAGLGAFAATSLTAPLGEIIRTRLSGVPKKAASLALTTAAGALYVGAIGASLGWLYEFPDPMFYLWLPTALGGALGFGYALSVSPDHLIPIGYIIYNLTRTILNALRAIEPLIMVIVFAVWVGIGPFAGVLALTLHTIAALGKLYSEQVESVMVGPLEAVQATGATRVQTIIYAVIPQIIPPYISFTMYRWDINVRMSTIIGFAGGGGIGFLLQQNIALLQYRAASVQMLAIAIVVATMDYLSTKLREKAI